MTDDRSMSWYIDIDEGELEDEITLGPVFKMQIAVGPTSIRVRRRPDPRPNGRQSFKESTLLIRPPYGHEFGLGANYE